MSQRNWLPLSHRTSSKETQEARAGQVRRDEFKKELQMLITTTELLGDADADNENQSERIPSGPSTSMAEITNALGRFESA